MAEVALRAIQNEEHDKKEGEGVDWAGDPYWVMEGAKNGGWSGD